MKQDKFYKKVESNSFFERWKKTSKDYNKTILRSQKNTILKILNKNISLNSLKVLEIGSFISDLLFVLKKNYNCKVEGIEPSSKACKYALDKFKIKILNKTFYESQYFDFKKKNKNKFDLIICDDVLSWIDRGIILEVLSSINWLLKDRGYIFIRDFSPNKNFARANHHWPRKNIYNFKVAKGHKKIFTDTGNYEVKYNRMYNTTKYQKIKISDKESNIWSDTLLRKTSKYQFKIINF